MRAVDIRPVVRFDGAVKALRFIFWLAWFLVAFVAFLVLLQYGPPQFTQGAGDLFAEAKGWAGLSR